MVKCHNVLWKQISVALCTFHFTKQKNAVKKNEET